MNTTNEIESEVVKINVNRWFRNHNLYGLYNRLPEYIDFEVVKMKNGKGPAYMFYDSSDANSKGVALVKCDDNNMVAEVVDYDEDFWKNWFLNDKGGRECGVQANG